MFTPHDHNRHHRKNGSTSTMNDCLDYFFCSHHLKLVFLYPYVPFFVLSLALISSKSPICYVKFMEVALRE